RIEAGNPPRAPIAFLQRVARRQIGRLIIREPAEILVEPRMMDTLPAPVFALEEENEPGQGPGEKRARLIQEAIRCARTNLPSLGRGKIRMVMNSRLNTIEAGEPDRSAASIGASLRMSAVEVRVFESRGFARLANQMRLQQYRLNPDPEPV
ncbi:MAG: hypothetical protein AB1646_26095, partial [Thermodesulfobacteriota bacterium]